MKKIVIIAIILSSLAGACTKEEITPRSYPRVKTVEATDITSGGATFRGEIFFTSVPILDHGFLWSEQSNPTLNGSDKISLGSKSGTGRFEAKCERSMQEGKKYYMRAYALSEDNDVYGNVVEFQSLGSKAPVLKDFFPSTATWDDTVTIVGENFSSVPSKFVVKFNNISSVIIEGGSDTVKVKVPYDLTADVSTLSISLVGNTSTLTKQFTLKSPLLESVTPSSGVPGTNVTIKGQFIRSLNPKVYFNDIEGTFVQWGPNFIECKVPQNLSSGKVDIKLVTGSGNLFDTMPLAFEVLGPKLFQVVPANAHVGDIIKLVGDFFEPSLESNIVMFDNFVAPVVAVTKTEIQVIVPYAERIDPTITVNSYGSIASIDMFSFLPPEITGFSPQRGTFNTEIIITGKHFLPGYPHRVFLDDVELINAYANSETEIRAFIPMDLSRHSGQIKIAWYDQELVSPGVYKTPWATISDFPGSYLNSSACLLYNNMAYIGLGGAPDLSKQFWKFDPVSKQWTQLNQFPGLARYQSFSFTVGTKGYVGGGWGTSDRVTDLWEYNFANDSWVKKSEIPWNGNVAMGFSLSNEGYTIEHDYSAGDSKLWKYNATADTWSMISTAPIIIDSNSSYFVIGTSIYVVDDSGYGISVWKYTSSTNQWTAAAPLPNRITFAFSTGGVGYGASNGELYKYDPALNTWSNEISAYLNRPSVIFSLVGKAFFIGGYNYDYYNTSYEYDPNF